MRPGEDGLGAWVEGERFGRGVRSSGPWREEAPSSRRIRMVTVPGPAIALKVTWSDDGSVLVFGKTTQETPRAMCWRVGAQFCMPCSGATAGT